MRHMHSVRIVLEELNVARMTRKPLLPRPFESGAADDLGRVEDVRAVVGLEEIEDSGGGVVCEQQGATELIAREPWQGWGGSVGVAARGQAPAASGTRAPRPLSQRNTIARREKQHFSVSAFVVAMARTQTACNLKRRSCWITSCSSSMTSTISRVLAYSRAARFS